MRQSIIERVARMGWDNHDIVVTTPAKITERILESAGFFTLLEAVEVFTEEKTNNVAHAWKQLDAAVAKARVGG